MKIEKIKKTERNITLDILKLIASYMVIFIHVAFFGNAGFTLDALARFAVPLFFLISGYFCYNNNTTKIKKKALHILYLYIPASLLYHFYVVLSFLLNGQTEELAAHYAQRIGISATIKYFVFNVPTSTTHLWFLLALIYVYVIQYFIRRFRISDKLVFLYSFTGLILHLFLGELLSAYGIFIPVHYLRNFFLMGYPFFGIGLFLKKYEKKILSFPDLLLIIVFAIGIIETLLSRFMIGKNELYAGSVLMALSLMTLALKYPIVTKQKSLWKLSTFSTSIYLFHVLVYKIIYNRVIALSLDTSSIFIVNMQPILVCLLTTIIAFIVTKLSTLIQKPSSHLHS